MNETVQAVILAAGKGTRMRPLTYDIPKPMLRIQGKPILAYTLSFLPADVSEVILVVNYLGRHIRDYFGEKYLGKTIRYVMQEELNGTGGALHSCRDLLRDRFLVLMGDDLYWREDLAKLAEHDLAILAQEVDDPTQFGVFRTDNQGHLLDIIEKPETKEFKLVNTGAYLINQKFFDHELVAIGNGEFGLPQTLVKMAKNNPIKILEATHWHPVGRPNDLESADETIKKFLK